MTNASLRNLILCVECFKKLQPLSSARARWGQASLITWQRAAYLPSIIGDLLAEWIVSGQPRIDLSPLSPSRLAVQTADETALREDCRRQYAFHYQSQI